MLHHHEIYIEHTYSILTMSVCTQLRKWIWNAERGFRLVESGLQLQTGSGSFPSSRSHSIENHSHMTDFLVWGRGKQAPITRLYCTCPAVRVSSWRGKSTCGGSQGGWSALYRVGRALGGNLRYRECVETPWIFVEHCATRVLHQQPWCWHRWVFNIGCDRAGGVACQEGHILQVCSLDTRTNKWHATQHDVGCYTQGNLQAMLLKQGCNAWSCHRHTEYCNTHSQCSDVVWRWETGVRAREPNSACLGLFAAAHSAASEEYCCARSELAGEWPLWLCVLRASGRSSMIDCQMSYIQATHSCRQQISRDVFHRAWSSREPVNRPLWALT